MKNHDHLSPAEHDHTHKSHESSLSDELACHLPYAAFSLALAFIILSFMHFASLTSDHTSETWRKGYHVLFHSFHYLHLIFAVTGTLVTYFRFARNIFIGIIISLIFPAIFCSLSDVALPTLASDLLGVPMKMHICFFQLKDLLNLLPFMIMGLITGLALRRHHESALMFLSLGSHFIHILISSMAAVFYVVSYGFSAWPKSMGLLYFLLVIAVVIPCTLSDIVIPMYCARYKRKKKL
ncbi:MAG: hypothetical protein WA432_03495 [Candidatus Babeliaceae bacterium]